MTKLIVSVILCLCFKAGSCQLQCVKGTPNSAEFSLNVTTHIKAEFGDCIRIQYELTFPSDKVTVPFRKIWFKDGDPQAVGDITVVSNAESGRQDTFVINGLPHGEHEYSLKLEWGCNQTYIFPKRVRISVSELTHGPILAVPPMMEGRVARLLCHSPRFCSNRQNVRWEWTKADGQSTVLHGGARDRDRFGRRQDSTLHLIPTAEYHNTNFTCVVDYGYGTVKTTVTLEVAFPPEILNGSRCRVEGKLLVCVCISRGNPLPPIAWPLAVSLTDFSVTSSSSMLTVTSNITMPAADHRSSSVKCISSNELGQAEVEIPLQNATENHREHDWSIRTQKVDAAFPWITAVSFGLNLVLLTVLIICAYKWRKSTQKKMCEETKTYASLNRVDVEQEYSTISPQPK